MDPQYLAYLMQAAPIPISLPAKREIHRISMTAYIKQTRDREGPNPAEDIEVQKKILDILRYSPKMWKNGSKPYALDWRKIGIVLHEKFKILVSGPQLKAVLQNAVETFKEKLKFHIQNDFASPLLTRALLSQWPLYSHFEYYHTELAEYEEKLRSEVDPNAAESLDDERKELYAQIEKNQEELEKNNSTLKCPRCFINYANEDARPRVLACGHTYCEKCCRELQMPHDKQMVQCPECNRKTKMSTFDVRELPTNYAIMQ